MNKEVNFKIAKMLKEKDWDKPTLSYYFEDGEFKENQLTGTNGYYGEEYCFNYGEFLENWNDNWVTKKNGDRCFGCENRPSYFKTYSAPTIADVIMWLYKKHGIWATIETSKLEKFNYRVSKKERSKSINTPFIFSIVNADYDFNSPTEAYEAAIEYTLNKLI